MKELRIKKMVKVLKTIIVFSYLVAYISGAMFISSTISFTRCIHVFVIIALIIIFSWLTVEILEAKER